MSAFLFLHLQPSCYIHPTHPDPCVLFPSAQASACIPFPPSSFASIIVDTVLFSCPNYTFPVYSGGPHYALEPLHRTPKKSFLYFFLTTQQEKSDDTKSKIFYISPTQVSSPLPDLKASSEQLYRGSLLFHSHFKVSYFTKSPIIVL